MWGAVVLLAAVALAPPIAVSAASGVAPDQIFWKNPRAPDAILCAKMVFRPPAIEHLSDPPFCRAFRQFQVIEVHGAWARIGADVWIETAVLDTPALWQRADPRVSRIPHPHSMKRTAFHSEHPGRAIGGIR